MHHITDFFGGKHHVFLDLLVSQTDVFQTVEAHAACRVAGQAVVGKDLRAALQADLVAQIDIDFFIVVVAACAG